jgi:hypothetical protein
MTQMTNTAALWIASANLIAATGRLREHEQWNADPAYRRFIDAEIRDAAKKIADWLDCDLVPRSSVLVGVGMTDKDAPTPTEGSK